MKLLLLLLPLIGSPRQAFALHEKGIVAEGLAFDAKRGRFLVSGVHAKKIFVIDRNGRATTFAGDFERGAFGMAIDAKHDLLWVATSSLDTNDAALLKIDLRNGRVLATLRPGDAEPHLFGDVTIAADGEVFVSDSKSPIVFHVDGGRLAPFARGRFKSLQGLAATSRYLYVSDYATGLHAIDRRSRDAVALPVPAGVSLRGVDGIYLSGDRSLIAIQNGTNPMRVLRLTLAPNGLAVASTTTVATNHEAMTDLTLGTFARGAFHFIANAGWEQPVDVVRVLRLKP